jgi:ParB-like chromosome segregation protein Spo0J
MHKYTEKNINELLPYINNSRTHSPEQVNQIASSIKEFGFTNPVLIDESNMVIAGHGRLLASQKLGLKNIPCIILTGLSEAQKKAYVIADNKLALNAGWDEAMLANEIAHLQEMDFNIDLLGFSADEINAICQTIESVELPDLQEGDKPPFSQVTFILHDTQKQLIDNAIKQALNQYQDPNNDNKNSNALYFICSEFLNDKC